jgi:hypothetical protein
MAAIKFPSVALARHGFNSLAQNYAEVDVAETIVRHPAIV